MPTLTPIDKNLFDEFYDATGADKPAPVGKTQLLGNILFGALPGPTKLASLPLNENFRKGFMEGMEKSGRVGVQSMMEALENQYKPDNAVAVNDAGEWLDQSGKVIPSQRRPNLLPITKSQPGQGWFGSNFEGAMPAMADVWNTMGGVGGKATLGAGPMLRPALKYQDKIYKAKEGQQHLDALPAHLQDTFQKMAMSGEDISNFNFGFINHKGHFLTREKALEYAIKEGILDPNDAKYGTLVTTMLNDSGAGGKLTSQAVASSKDKLRLNRAKEQGYDIDTTLYHGSPTFKEQVGATFDLNYKPRTDTGYLGNGVYFTPNKWIAEVYAKPMNGSGPAGEVLEAFVKKGNYKKFIYDENYVKTLEDFAKSLGVNDTFNSKNWGKNFGEALKKAGYDGAKGLNTDGSLAEMVVFDPAAIRSKNAKFDPKNIGKSGILLNDSGGGQKLASQAAAQSREMKAPTFYSAAEKAVEGIKQNKASGDQWLSTIGNQKGVKGEELEWTGLKDFLSGKQSVTKQEIQDYLKENKVELNEVWKGTDDGKLKIQPSKDNEGEWDVVDDKGRVRFTGTEREHAQEYLNEEIQLNPKTKTKYHDYQLSGGENYRELLLTLPVKTSSKAQEAYDLTKRMNAGEFNSLDDDARRELFKKRDQLLKEAKAEEGSAYKSSHWDEPNILAHMRMNDRTIDGKKSLHLEEIQSDWHQQGRDKGYSSSKSKAEFDRLNKEFEDARSDLGFATEKKANELLGMSYQKYRAMYPAEKDEALKKLKEYRAKDPEYVALEKKVEYLEKARNAVNPSGGVPDAPFKKTWHELALKRAIREAAENGYERLSWTPGEAQAARYDLSKQLKELQYLKNDDGTYEIAGITSKGDGFNHPEKVTASKLPDVVGKEMAEKIIKNEGKRNRGQPPNGGYFDGVDLKIGGEGMKGFYDQIIPKSISKLMKEYNLKIEKGKTEKGDEIFYIDLPSETRNNIINKGFPLFSGTPVLVPVNYDPFSEENKL